MRMEDYREEEEISIGREIEKKIAGRFTLLFLWQIT